MNTFFDLFNGFDSYSYHSEKSDDSYKLELLIPGFNKNEINIEVKNHKLIIEGNPKEETFFKKHFTKSFLISDNVDIDKINAKQENGILYLTLPESAKHRKLITIA